MKRKHVVEPDLPDKVRKAPKTTTGIRSSFCPGLFEPKTVGKYQAAYTDSEPYKHAVVNPLIADDLLRSVRKEIVDDIHFTPKETDIYKIHQSGDLANLSGLPTSALKRLPSLLELRDALYSTNFRAWISQVSGAGALSGKKTDMAVNVYAPGCHLLCHDDVIGSRRVSYILYLTNPDRPWKESWGGALRLYPTKLERRDTDGNTVRIPDHEWSKSIPPAWNQLSFFAVQPGHSFHDVEEVYKREAGLEEDDDGGRIRMAISGWYHIPQEGEEGYEPGLEQKLTEQSSLQQLQGKDDSMDLPKAQWLQYDEQDKSTAVAKDEEAEADLTEQDLEFLLNFMTPHYLTPDTVEELSELFAEESSLQLANLLSKKFSAKLREQIASHDHSTREQSQRWHIARPPYKHRFMFRQPMQKSAEDGNGRIPMSAEVSAYEALLEDFLPSLAFRKWLSLATSMTLGKSSILARRFRRGLDYSLATGHDQEEAQLEWCLNVTPSKGWGADELEDTNGSDVPNGKSNRHSNGNAQQHEDEEDNVGGYELYMAGDEADDNDDAGSNDGVEIPSGSANPSATGAGNRRSAKQKKADPAVYRASAEEDDDGILFSNPAAWNTMSIVLRDKGTLKFVKYVSKAAQGDRWDMTGCVEVLDDSDEDDNDEEAESNAVNSVANGTSMSNDHTNGDDDEEAADDEEEWNGFGD